MGIRELKEKSAALSLFDHSSINPIWDYQTVSLAEYVHFLNGKGRGVESSTKIKQFIYIFPLLFSVLPFNVYSNVFILCVCVLFYISFFSRNSNSNTIVFITFLVYSSFITTFFFDDNVILRIRIRRRRRKN